MTPTADPSAKMKSGYLLIDGSNYPGLLDCEPLPSYACVPAALTNIAELLPRLVDIKTLDNKQLQAVREMLALQTAGRHPWAICAVLTADVEIEELSNQICQFLSVIDDDHRSVLWRFFDPRVFSLTMAIFNAEQRRSLLGPIREWRFAWRKHWWAVAGDACKVDPLYVIDMALPSQDQWPILRLSRLIEQVFLRLEGESSLNSADCLRVQQAAIACLAEASVKFRLQEPEDLIDFACLGVKYGQAFRSHPKLNHAKADLENGRLSWFAFTDSLDSTDWRAFERSLR